MYLLLLEVLSTIRAEYMAFEFNIDRAAKESLPR